MKKEFPQIINKDFFTFSSSAFPMNFPFLHHVMVAGGRDPWRKKRNVFETGCSNFLKYILIRFVRSRMWRNGMIFTWLVHLSSASLLTENGSSRGIILTVRGRTAKRKWKKDKYAISFGKLSVFNIWMSIRIMTENIVVYCGEEEAPFFAIRALNSSSFSRIRGGPILSVIYGVGTLAAN